ncbi:telomere repeat-binding protein 2 isoform X2 [Cornus florida]|uniref:telomere repeat-binding protein 2 isoform X2 n=1 Tax=Cornus florida TaxID=4283 RepID=UPI0028A194D5|nr:telomere repeat-binding protein 2 isoform X2 [Cornus florida]
MVFQKRLDYGFNGYQVPPMPRAARSARRRGSFRKKADCNQICPFDILATVAGQLLLEEESYNNTLGKEHGPIVKDHVKKKQQDENNPLKVESCDRGSNQRSSIVSGLVSEAPAVNRSLKEFTTAQVDTCLGPSSIIASDYLNKVASAEKLVNGKSKVELGIFGTKVEVGSSQCRESCYCTVEDVDKELIKIELPDTGEVSISTRADKCGSKDQMASDSKPHVVISLGGDHIPLGSFPVHQDDVKLVIRDDDENSSGCTQPSTAMKAFRPPPRVGDGRTSNLLASKYWKVNHNLKDEEHSKTEIRALYRNRKNCYKRHRSQKDYPVKKRKLFSRSRVSNSGSPRKGFSRDAFGSSRIHGASLAGQRTFFQSRDSHGMRAFGATMPGATETSASVSSQHTSFQSKDSHVKLSIKSFKVPELVVEIPETATVGSLKRTVMEAVTAILGCGLHVGVLLQGKKIRDDNKTLQQTGISHDNKPDALGFTLEPNPLQAPSTPCPKDHSSLLSCGGTQPLTRCPPIPDVVHTASVVQQGTSDASLDPSVTNLGDFIENAHDSAPSPPDMSIDKRTTISRALFAFPAMNAEKVAIVPMQKSQRSEVVQRRARRPFSVSEVQALVQAVEKIGTGRWRDVKLRAFDNAKHRTYVDLKDKWKTLVHTAKISPQQRRGEPVPEELLDRVLAAHAYWSQQPKQPETCSLL